MLISLHCCADGVMNLSMVQRGALPGSNNIICTELHLIAWKSALTMNASMRRHLLPLVKLAASLLPSRTTSTPFTQLQINFMQLTNANPGHACHADCNSTVNCGVRGGNNNAVPQPDHLTDYAI